MQVVNENRMINFSRDGIRSNENNGGGRRLSHISNQFFCEAYDIKKYEVITWQRYSSLIMTQTEWKHIIGEKMNQCHIIQMEH